MTTTVAVFAGRVRSLTRWATPTTAPVFPPCDGADRAPPRSYTASVDPSIPSGRPSEGVPMTDEETSDTLIDTSVPQTARVWNYWLGGKDNYAVDRALGDQIAAEYPIIVDIARADRAVLNRAV